MTYIGPAVLDGTTRAVPSEGNSVTATGNSAAKVAGAADSYSPAASHPAVGMSPVFGSESSAASLAAEWTEQVQRRAAGAYRSSALLR